MTDSDRDENNSEWDHDPLIGDGNNGGWDDDPLIRDPQVTEHLNIVFDILRKPHRRYLLYYLYSVEEAIVSLDDVVEAVQRYEAARTDTAEKPDRESVRLGLVNIHLPKLVSGDVLDYDSDREIVRFWEHKPLQEWVYHARHLEFD